MTIPHKNDLSQRLPRYLARAIESGSAEKTEKAINRAMSAGFTVEQLEHGMDMLVTEKFEEPSGLTN